MDIYPLPGLIKTERPFSVFSYGIISSDTLDQTDKIRELLNSNHNIIYFPPGNYRCKNLWINKDNMQVIIDGTIKQIDGTGFDITKDAVEGQPVVYIENATDAQMDFLESLCNEAPNYYYYVTYWDDLYTIEGGGTGQVHHNAWTSRLLSVDKVNKTITMADNIPAMPNYCGGALTIVNNPKITVYYNVFEVKDRLSIKFSGTGTLDANRSTYLDANPVWISGEVGHPEFANDGANFIECINSRFNNNFEVIGIFLQNGKDNIMMWYMTGYIHLNNIHSYNAHNKNIAYLISGIPDYSPTALIENCFVNGSEYEDGILGYANADNCTYLNNIVWNCPRNGYTFNRQNSTSNYGENNDAYNCGTGFEFNRGGITDLLEVKNSYVNGGGRHTKDLTYQPAIKIRSQITAKCSYITMTNVGIICDLHTYAFQIMNAEEINIIWESTCANKYKLIKGKFSLPHSYGYFLLVDGLCSNIVLDGGGVCVVENFVRLVWIKSGATGVVVKNFQFNNYLSIGTIDGSITFQDNYFNGVFYTSGYPATASVIIALSFDASIGVTRSGEDTSLWEDQSDYDHDAIQTTDDLKTHWLDAQVNSLPVIKGDGSNDIMTFSSLMALTGDFTLIAVIGGATTPNYMFGYNNNLYWRFTGSSLTWKNSSSHTFDHSNLPLDTGYFIHRLTRRSNLCRSYRNTLESLTGALTNSVGMQFDKLFSNGVGNYGVGAIAELRVYMGNLTDDELADIENALMLKYDLEIPIYIPPVNGLILHLDAGTGITKSIDDVLDWDDLSTVDNDAIQGTLSLCPHWLDNQINGLPVIYGDGIDDILNLDNSIICTGDFIVIIVMGGTTTPNYMCGYSSTQYYRFIQNSLIWRCSTTYSFDHSNVPLTTGYFIHHIRRISGLVRSYRNNIESITGPLLVSWQMAINKIFSYGSNWGSGRIAELRVYNENMSNEDLQDVLDGLSLKYNIPI